MGVHHLFGFENKLSCAKVKLGGRKSLASIGVKAAQCAEFAQTSRLGMAVASASGFQGGSLHRTRGLRGSGLKVFQ